MNYVRCKAMWGVLLLLAAGSTASAQQWAQKMFKVTSHNFGTVARDAKAVYEFELTNAYKEDVHIASLRTSCNCATLTVKDEQRTLKTWQKGAIVATFNTRSFLGHRHATITVTFDRPYYAEVQLSVSGFIRSDVVFNPGSINFGEVGLGATAERKTSISYIGRNSWRIVDVRSASQHLEVELSETGRGNGRVHYDMIVRLTDGAPAGYLNDQLFLVTDESTSSSIPLAVEGRVVSPLTVSPASLFLGVVAPGQKVERQLVVRAKKPFKVTAIHCSDKCFTFQPSDDARTLHLIPLTFTAPAQAGPVEQQIEIETDLGLTAACVATATVQAPPGDSE